MPKWAYIENIATVTAMVAVVAIAGYTSHGELGWLAALLFLNLNGPRT